MLKEEKFSKPTEEQEALIKKSLRTNELHMELCTFMDRVIILCDEAIEMNLDPGCVIIFKTGKEHCSAIKNISKAEIATYVRSNKWQ